MYNLPDKIENNIDIDSILKKYTVNLNDNYSEPPVILSVIEGDELRNIMHKSSFSAIKGQAKGRKSTLMSLIAASYCNTEQIMLNTFRTFRKNEMCIYFDTEQANHECMRFMRIIKRLSGSTENFKMIRLRSFSPDERFEIIQKVTEKFKDKIGLTIIDGVLDLVTEMNSEKQASEITTWLLKSTEEYNIHTSVIIHENFETGKAAGHVGSSILRRAETIISVNLNKHNKNFSIITCDRMRGKNFEQFQMGINNDLPFISYNSNDENKNETPF